MLTMTTHRLTPVWNGLSEPADQKQVLDFFAIFARFEYALKACGFAHAQKKYVEPDWEKFIKEVEKYSTPATDQLVAAVRYLVDEPPKGQILKENRATYEATAKEPSGKTELAKAVRSAKRVRNNLFHGGKYMGASESSVRNRRLLESSIVVLSAAIHAVDGLRFEYEHN